MDGHRAKVEVDGAAAAPRRSHVSLVTSEQTSARMAKQGRRDTKPELELRRRLHRLGYRYRVNSPLPGMPRRRADITFGPKRLVVFVDGCFWHGCPEHATSPRNNGLWWSEKLRKNVERDRDTDARLQELGWAVLRIWEHEDPDEAVHRVVGALTTERGSGDCT
ncbi:very short patch repair endonuclease [Kribbella sandramycini]|uniref:DNA mismatch endonuclease (Patch repair protein) n=1 Tax=Kribbella sandramycini TaxID=60450 RepID=A0A7Y4P2Y9_9ACTN|nr:very short patch repair endonuclease [Kribbella sandramycini]MBB6570446.1 DNA mismatch endonuclease (patch repair protein) [Kribbella sandramycini]NOL45306.1 very short patch repair endonuclease [Kribbella sandramycini]